MAATASSSRLPIGNARSSDIQSIAPFFKIDEGTRRVCTLLNTAGQAGVRALLELIVAEEDGIVRKKRRLSVLYLCASYYRVILNYTFPSPHFTGSDCVADCTCFRFFYYS